MKKQRKPGWTPNARMVRNRKRRDSPSDNPTRNTQKMREPNMHAVLRGRYLIDELLWRALR